MTEVRGVRGEYTVRETFASGDRQERERRLRALMEQYRQTLLQQLTQDACFGADEETPPENGPDEGRDAP